jgi:hypothetical protein
MSDLDLIPRRRRFVASAASGRLTFFRGVWAGAKQGTGCKVVAAPGWTSVHEWDGCNLNLGRKSDNPISIPEKFITICESLNLKSGFVDFLKLPKF